MGGRIGAEFPSTRITIVPDKDDGKISCDWSDTPSAGHKLQITWHSNQHVENEFCFPSCWLKHMLLPSWCSKILLESYAGFWKYFIVWENHMSSDSEQGAAPFSSVTLTDITQDVTLHRQPWFCDSHSVSTKPLDPFNHAARGPIGGPDEAEAVKQLPRDKLYFLWFDATFEFLCRKKYPFVLALSF